MMRRIQILSDYGMLGVLLLLCLFFSVVTLEEQHPEGEDAANRVVPKIAQQVPRDRPLIIVARPTLRDQAFARTAKTLLQERGYRVLAEIRGEPPAIRRRLQSLADRAAIPAALVTVPDFRLPLKSIQAHIPPLAQTPVIVPDSYRWPTFLLRDNLINVVNQIVVIAIIAIGMTMVIITAGIDLSVGSLIALSAVIAARLIAGMGGTEAGTLTLILASLLAILACGGLGMLSGVIITRFGVPPFIATLGWMLVASGLAYIISEGQSIYAIPDRFVWLGRGTAFLGIPNAVVLMALLYAAAYVLMTHTVLGRYIYAVGGNPEAARLSGVRVQWILVFVYTVSGLMAGLGGIVLASQLKSGAPTYGLLYELYVIAAVVVGGTSLSGGEGKIMGTLIGALIIGVIQNGMNLTGVETYTQKVVLGLVILGAVLLDKWRSRR